MRPEYRQHSYLPGVVHQDPRPNEDWYPTPPGGGGGGSFKYYIFELLTSWTVGSPSNATADIIDPANETTVVFANRPIYGNLGFYDHLIIGNRGQCVLAQDGKFYVIQPLDVTGGAAQCRDYRIRYDIVSVQTGDYGIVEADVTITGVFCCDTENQVGSTVKVFDEDECYFGDETPAALVGRRGWASKMKIGSKLPTPRGVGTVAAGVGAITPGLPTGTEADDMLVLFIETENGEAITVSGWTQAPDSPQETTGTRLTIFWKRAVAGESAPTTSDSGDHQIGKILGVKGVVTTGDPWNVTAGSLDSVSDTTGSITGDTTTVSNCLIVVACTTNRDETNTIEFSDWTNANLTAITEQIDNTTDAGAGGGIGVATGDKATAGAYGATTVELTNASTKAMWSGALIPSSCKFVVDGLCCPPVAAEAPNLTKEVIPYFF